jgi:hypothetical protein
VLRKELTSATGEIERIRKRIKKTKREAEG